MKKPGVHHNYGRRAPLAMLAVSPLRGVLSLRSYVTSYSVMKPVSTSLYWSYQVFSVRRMIPRSVEVMPRTQPHIPIVHSIVHRSVGVII